MNGSPYAGLYANMQKPIVREGVLRSGERVVSVTDVLKLDLWKSDHGIAAHQLTSAAWHAHWRGAGN